MMIDAECHSCVVSSAYGWIYFVGFGLFIAFAETKKNNMTPASNQHSTPLTET